MDSSKHSLVEYLMAMKNEKFDEAVKILTSIIQDIPATKKDALVTCTKYRICALYKVNQYEMIINDCSKLQGLGVIIDDDVETAMIKAESLYRFYTEKAMNILENLSIKLSVIESPLLYMNVYILHDNYLLRNDAPVSRQSPFKKK